MKQLRISLQNTQAAYAAQYKKNKQTSQQKQPNQKVDRSPKEIFLQRHTDD